MKIQLNRRQALAGIAAGSAVLGFPAIVRAQRTRTITVTSILPATSPQGRVWTKMQEEVDKALGPNRLKFNLVAGGVMGGETTGCSDATTDVFLESAWFDPLATAQTGRTLGISSDAQYRFARRVDPGTVVPGIELATQMILDLLQ